MRFAFYDNLSPAQQRTYRKSDKILVVAVPDVAALRPLAAAVQAPLEAGDPPATQAACQALVDAMNAQLATPPVTMRVLERRPHDASGELQGLYEPDEVTGGAARISVWMRTARKEQVVKYRTFVRTVLHELVHHLDYELYRLPETFHTEGFYARESALVRALIDPEPA